MKGDGVKVPVSALSSGGERIRLVFVHVPVTAVPGVGHTRVLPSPYSNCMPSDGVGGGKAESLVRISEVVRGSPCTPFS